jgi:anthranilate phosphoribosyltransferase
MSLKDSLILLTQRADLDAATCKSALEEILADNAEPLQIAAFLALLRAKPETSAELYNLTIALKQHMIPVHTVHKVLDMVGTGGDNAKTVNISTGSAILAASCGVKVAKQGNRSVSSLCGSADVLTALGVNIGLTAAQISQCIDQLGIGFCFAPHFHPPLQTVRNLRKTLNVPTTFNLLGPLLNPTQPAHYVLGVYDKALLLPMATVLQQLGTQHSFIVHGNGLDEISTLGPTHLIEITPDNIQHRMLDPADYGFSYCHMAELRGGNAADNATLLLHAFSAQTRTAITDTLILNSAVALYLYGTHTSLADAINHAALKLFDGSALKLLNHWIEFSHAVT